MKRFVSMSAVFWFCMVLVLSLVGCDEEDSSVIDDDDDDDTVTCLGHSDCPTMASCQLDAVTGEGVCLDDACATTCTSDADCAGCSVGSLVYVCMFGSDDQLKCQPQQSSDADGDADGDNTCVTNQDCGPGYECDSNSGMCIPLGDDDDDDNDDEDGDTDDDDDDDDTTDDDDDDTVDGDGTCSSDADCGAGQICTGGSCVADCSTTGCTYGTCNANTGRCEFCDPLCSEGQCCNYGGTFYYCGSCCSEPCPDGTVCQSGNCVTPSCPSSCDTTDPCYACGPETGYLCEETNAVGCGGERKSMECLRTNEACREGVDVCCSGNCLMGTCL